MSGHNFGSEFGQVIASTINDHMHLPPRQKNVHRAVMGTVLLAGCAYSAWWSNAFIGLPAPSILAAFIRSPSGAPSWVWWPVMIWIGAALLGAIWVVVGVANSRGPRETMDIFWSGVRLCVAGALLVFGAYLPRDWNMPLINLALQGFYLCWLASSMVEMLLLLRGPPPRMLQAQTHGQARTASAADLRQKGILR